MYEALLNVLFNIRQYFVFVIYGDKDENTLKEIYKKNDIDLNKVYQQLNSINKYVAKEKDYRKIVKFLDREIKYENEITNYENLLDLELETCDKVKRIELMTYLIGLKKTFEKIIHIKDEYYKEQIDKKNK